ncbi:MAG: erythromycin esterase family protein [Candidatus Pedobacter colombiensis]|uniref:Erythromycin esterase family protein n=1 Tax=Candidatus Pedobacter colombiensis TaxID=3121371 RepID=A0AAJ5W441_9SPHI|nr:erythromycin esterase family protein [Pedobacter sp.]WEK17796.1 MAG: erythromycin esterase family protein [Pedobacter sp.]
MESNLEHSKALDPLLERIGDAHCVLLGEASHGTHEYYTWRTAISKRLIEEKGFNFIAIEGDWPDCYRLNRYIKGYDSADKSPEEMLRSFRRWPTWMWANWEVTALISWLKDYNKQLYPNKKIGFYGLDVYSLWESLYVITEYLEGTDPATAAIAKKAIQCFEPYDRDEYRYAREQATIADSCRDTLVSMLTEIRKKASGYNHDPEAALNTEQNANVAVNAEEYYRNMTGFNDNTWNLRESHMIETLYRLRKFHGAGAKTIIWAHNTHIGDARYTNMHAEGMVNLGQLLREEMGLQDVVLVGFGSYQGTVIAAKEWGGEMEEMNVPEAHPGSVEELLHQDAATDRLLIFERDKKQRFDKMMPHRAIGVIYHPKRESYGASVLSSRYDAFIYIDQTMALHPLYLRPDGHQIPETYPFSY